jgi:aryl-alcohol dehydrogenase-like predicted oxidoreductase
MLALCDEQDLASLNRVPLLMGVLTGRWTPDSHLPADDRRSDWFEQEGFLQVLARAESLRPVLTRGGRTYVQGALAWLWARSPRAIPLPGFRTTEQVEGLAGGLAFGPLAAGQMAEIEVLLGRG